MQVKEESQETKFGMERSAALFKWDLSPTRLSRQTRFMSCSFSLLQYTTEYRHGVLDTFITSPPAPPNKMEAAKMVPTLNPGSPDGPDKKPSLCQG